MNHYPFATKRPNKKRDNPRRIGPDRVKLDAEGKERLRQARYLFAAGRCEECSKEVPLEGDLMTRAHMAHNEHGPRKSDEFDRVKIKCYDCHAVEEHNPKSVSRRPGRVMSKREALENWQGKKCYCGSEKPKESTFCANCLEKFSPQLRSDVQEVTGKEYLQTVALCEQELLAAEVNGRVA